MKQYIIYNIHTGRIVSRKTLARGDYLPPKGPLNIPGGDHLAVLHCDCDLNADRVEHGRVVPKGMQQRRKEERHLGWMEFRQARGRLLDDTDFLLASDYPLSKADRKALKQKRKASRDIPENTKDPSVAMDMLKAIWSDEQ